MPAVSRILLAKPETFSHGSNTSGITSLIRKSYWAEAIAAREVRTENVCKKQLCRHQSQLRRRGRRCFRHTSWDFPAAHDAAHSEAGCPPGVHRGPQEGSRNPPAACGRAPCWSRSWKPCGEKSRFPGRTCDHTGDPQGRQLTLEQLVKNHSPWEGLILEKLMENCLL